MKDARSYVNDFNPANERLEALLDRVQRDAFAAGSRAAAVQLLAIAADAKVRTDKRVAEVMNFQASTAAK